MMAGVRLESRECLEKFVPWFVPSGEMRSEKVESFDVYRMMALAVSLLSFFTFRQGCFSSILTH